MTRLFSWKPALSYRGRKFKGLRGWAGKPSHPPLTDIPVAAYVLAVVFDAISFFSPGGDRLAADMFRAATYLFAAGLVVSVPTALTGFWDWLKSTPRGTQAWRTANAHMAVMVTVTLLAAGTLALRAAQWDGGATGPGVLALSALVAALVVVGATYGGSLVYDYGFNVETAGDSPVWHESEVDVYPGGK
jgi:uncharacterized membrane protein